MAVRSVRVEAGEYKATPKGQAHHRRFVGLIVSGKEGREMLCLEKSNAQELSDQLWKILRRMI